MSGRALKIQAAISAPPGVRPITEESTRASWRAANLRRAHGRAAVGFATVAPASPTSTATSPPIPPAAPPRPPVRRRLPGDLRRRQLLDVAIELLSEGGAEAVTMEGVAARAGVSKALGYRYFDNADQLLLALHDREMAEMGIRVRSALP